LKRQPARQPALARKIQQSEQQKANAERFRRRAIDAALKRLLRLADEPLTYNRLTPTSVMTEPENAEIPAPTPEIQPEEGSEIAPDAVGVE
jgi:hypothetical protein